MQHIRNALRNTTTAPDPNERFQRVREMLQKEGGHLPMPTGNEDGSADGSLQWGMLSGAKPLSHERYETLRSTQGDNGGGTYAMKAIVEFVRGRTVRPIARNQRS